MTRIRPALWQKRPSELCQLAQTWKGGLDQYGTYAERKHDGWRFLWINGQAFTRKGMSYQGIGHIERGMRFLQRHFHRPMFFDGEFVVGSGLHTLEQTKRHQEQEWRAGDAGKVWLFDCLPMEEWEYAGGDTPLARRKIVLAEGFERMHRDPLSWEFGWSDGVECPIALVEHEIVDTPTDIVGAARRVWADGGEGVVIKDPSAPYRRTRNEAWRKFRRDIEGRKAND